MAATVRWGLLVGLVITAVDLAINLGSRSMLTPLLTDPMSEAARSSAGPLMGLSCLSLLAGVVLYFLAGNRAATETGRSVQGVLAGLIAGAISGVVSLLVELVYPMPKPQVPGAEAFMTPEALLIGSLFGLLVSLVIAAAASGVGAWWATRNLTTTD